MQYLQGDNLCKNWYIKLVKKSKSWYKYAKDTYFLDKVTNRLKLELNELPSQYSRSTYPSSFKENEDISAEIMKLIKKIEKMSIANHCIMNSFWIFFLQ